MTVQLTWMIIVFTALIGDEWVALGEGNSNDWRLPRSIKPHLYQVRLLPFLEPDNFTTEGRVEILTECFERTNRIVLHAADLTILKDRIRVEDFIDSRAVPVESCVEDKTRQFIVISTGNETLTEGKFYKITIEFEGQLNNKLNGFYRASYKENGTVKFLAATQFSPSDARRAFPCFDEPGMKARFQITLGRHQSKISTSNMPLKTTRPHPFLADYVWDEFETTVPMSTYILAFIVHDFQSSEIPDESSSIRFRIWTRREVSNQTQYAASLGPKILHHFEQFFSIAFPLPKLDMFAIPDISVSAMENWGLITYRETVLLFDREKSSASSRQRGAYVMAHELAHQWFGNLVTMQWWSDLWLKEGFASYFAYLGMDVGEPSLNASLQFTIAKTQSVFAADALSTSHPLSMPVSKSNEINEIFDDIAYEKGPAIIRMLAHFVGEKTFRHGLTAYLNRLKYQNAVQDDLWSALTEQAIDNELDLPIDIKTLMDSWSLHSGYPVVSIERDYRNQTATLTQERFYLNSNASSSNEQKWWIPLTFTKDFKSVFLTWMLGNESSLALDLSVMETHQWVIFNVDQVGYYRVNYDERNWRLIIKQLQEDHEKISTLSRAQLLDDAFNLARTGRLSYEILFEVCAYLRNEKNFVPWKSALENFRYIDTMLSATSTKSTFQIYLKWLMEPIYDHVGFDERDGDLHLTSLNRNQILVWACKLGIPECIRHSKEVYEKWMANPDDPKIIETNQKYLITCSAIASGGRVEWNFAYHRYLTTNLVTEKDTLLRALSCSRDNATLTRLLDWSLNSTSGIRRQDIRIVLASVAANPLGQSRVFHFVIERWSEMVKSFPSLSVLARIFDSVTSSLNTNRDLALLQQLNDGKMGDLGTAFRSIRSSLERTRINLEWMNSHYSSVANAVVVWQRTSN